VAHHSQEVCQLVVGLDAGQLGLPLQKPFPDVTPVEVVFLALGLGDLEEPELDTVVLAEEVEVLDVALNEVWVLEGVHLKMGCLSLGLSSR
jgi:hypothetical protein